MEMFSKRSQGQVSVNSAQMKCLMLFGLAFCCFQDIHASQHCDSMSDSGSVCVTITNPPRPNITDDEMKSLRCSWDTSSFDFFEWAFNGSFLSPGRFNMGQTYNDYTIPGSPQAHGEYRCVVSKKGNKGDREIAKLFIYYFPRIVFEEPINRINPTTENVSVGELLSYTCTATNHDRKMWTDRYKNPILNTTDGRITVTTGHTDSLTINRVTHEDTKEYYCFAVVYSLNESGPVIQELHLFRPVLVHGRPTILCYEPSKAVTPGSLVSFLCKVQAYPGPVSISWNGSRERSDVSNVGIQNMLYAFKVIVNAWNSTLSFKDFVEVDDSGLYTITARNVHGESSATVELQVLHIPGSLMQPVVVALSPTRVRVSWKEPENKDALELLHYMVLYGVVGSQRQQVNVSADELDVELTVLPVTEYYFVVGAVNRLGTGDLSHRETITTETSVPIAPVSVTVDMSTVTPESAIVTWSPLTGAYTGGFDVVRYIVSYKRVDEEWYMARTLDAEPDVSQVTVGELEPLSAYIASVKGVNALGEGFPAESQIFSTPELYAPSSPSDVTPLKSSSADSSVALNVCWTPGPDSYHIQTYQILVYQRSNGSQLQLYKVVYVSADSVQVVQRQECTLVSGLQTDSCYWFSVAAHNAAGASNASRTSDSSSCTVSGLTDGLEDILREPEVLAPIVLAVVIVAILLLLCVTVCMVRRNSRKKGSGLYDATESSQWGTSQQQSAGGCDSLTSIRGGSSVATCSPRENPNQTNNQFSDRKANLPRPSQLGVKPDLCTTSITPDSGIPSLPIWDKMDLGPAASYHPPQGSVVDNEISNEAEKLIQWTLGPAHESRDTPPIVDRSVSVDQSDSGLDNGEDVSHFDRQVSNPGMYGSELDFQYTDNVAYGTVSSHRQAGSSERSRGTQKQSVGMIASDTQFTEQTVGVTEWDSGPDRPFVTLRQDPNCREKEFVTFRQPPRVPPKSHTSSSSLQTSL